MSDEQTEFQLLDRRSFQHFCGLEHSANIPDHATIWNFGNRIGADGVNAIFTELDRQIRTQGLEASAGQIVDATLVPAPRQNFTPEEKEILEQGATPADWKPARRWQKDVDARWTRKHGKSTHSYKFTVSVDRKHKPVRDWLAEWNTSGEIYADKGYVGAEREERLREQGYRHYIQRKGAPGKPLSTRQQGRNRRIAKVRARVEHVFAAITQWGGRQIHTIGQARASFAIGMMVLVYNMRRLAFLAG